MGPTGIRLSLPLGAGRAPSSRLTQCSRNGDRKFERAALKYLRRYLDEANPSPVGVAQITALLAERDSMMRGL